ncbi:MAG: dTMP kinase [Sideroxydans sp.]|nr:dTMP kinase [Sideroxydans sp.]
MSKARFITFEGVDGAGKSTGLEWFANALRERGVDLLMTREPGGTPLGEKLRELLLHETMHPETEAMLMFASRREHVEQVIRPALLRGTWVISDRFSDASFAYQGGGRGVSVAKLEQLEQLTHGDLQPDLTVLFDIPIEVARERLSNTVSLDKFEREQGEFFERVRQAYLARVEKTPQRYAVIRAEKTLQEVHQQLADVLAGI